jgi:hypothetical protein
MGLIKNALNEAFDLLVTLTENLAVVTLYAVGLFACALFWVAVAWGLLRAIGWL